MSKFAEFERELEQLIGRPSTLRPFICDGSPLTCTVMIVGANAATELPNDFWDFWNPNHGFLKDRWFEAYKAHRKNSPLEPGRKRRLEVSYTRRVLGWISGAASPVRILETNIYAAPTNALRALHTKDRTSEVFNFLIEVIKPALVITHGNDAKKFLNLKTPTTDVWHFQHFSRGWSRVESQELGKRIAKFSLKPEQL